MRGAAAPWPDSATCFMTQVTLLDAYAAGREGVGVGGEGGGAKRRKRLKEYCLTRFGHLLHDSGTFCRPAFLALTVQGVCVCVEGGGGGGCR